MFRTMVKPPTILLVVSGAAQGTRIAVPLGGLVIGRSGSPEGRLGDDPALSRRHAVIVHSDRGELVVSDLGSSNGTFLNGRRVDGPGLVRPGDIIALGNTKLQAIGPSPGSSPATAGTAPAGAQSRMAPPPPPHPAAAEAQAPAPHPGMAPAAPPHPAAAPGPAPAHPAPARPGAGPIGGAAGRPQGTGALQGPLAGSSPASGPRTRPADGVAHADLAGIVQAELASLARQQWRRLVSKFRAVTGYVALAVLGGLVVTAVMMLAM